ncbi:transporter substrate-binding domain-containing protein [Pseudomonas sp. TH34]|uniref:transporter substrate-binding domain-containing protein n=1 Tax=Pseudomonas sp. TH34 TaxID=2796399 RepID=UPI001912CF80|nr:transporter substrate-binding domain-containing protein [Pseudomonas sp. TH34]MBK5408899.1 transporter substrate-binding domain-containing protein [Pseudomonas sp. TH34]
MILGVSRPSFPPLDIVYDDDDYEGISADVIALLSQQLGIEVSVVNLPDRAQALDALQSGQVDMLSSANSFELMTRPVVLSHPYVDDSPALFRRLGENRSLPDDLHGMTIAMAAEYRPEEEVRKQFPGARLALFKSQTEAMAAVAFEHADIYLGDSLSAYYMINQSFFNYVKFDRTLGRNSDGFSFALKHDNVPLLQILNKSIDDLGRLKLTYIIKRWAGGGYVLPGDKVVLSAQEQRWIARHPVVRMVINDDLAPAAFFDANGNFNGITADLLNIITLRTGLQFQVARTGSFNNLQQALRTGEADLTMLIPTAERETFLRFTHSFATSSFAVVTANSGAKFDGLQSLDGKRLAIANGQAVIPLLREKYPQIELITPATTLDSLSMVANGSADAAMMSLSIARYYTIRLYDNRLQIAGITSGNSATTNFAMRRSDTELQSILNKVILSIPPDEMNSITNRWRPNSAMSGQTWRDYRQVIAEIVAVALLIVASILVKVFLLRREVRKRQAVEQVLSDQLQFLQTLSDAMPRPIYVRDREGRMLSCARSYEHALNLSLKDVLGKTALEMPGQYFEAAPEFHRDYLNAMERGEPLQRRCEIILGNKKIWIDHWIQPFRDSGGTIRGVICGWLDITEQYALIEELRTAKNSADDASRAKTQFLATMSHEIRTPMNAMIGTLELALKRADRGLVDRPSIEIAHASAKNLLELIADILDIVRIESGRLSLSPRRSNLRHLVESVVRVFDGLARQKGLELILDLDPSINSDVLIDPMRFKQVLSNLLGNAIKFTNTGFVKVHISGEHIDACTLALEMQVEDSGIGISEDDQLKLFQPFAQVNQDPMNGRGGTGLGLVICRSLCEMMGGALYLSSTPGTGTRIDIDLTLTRLEPAPLINPRHERQHQAHRHGDMRILVADDHGMSRQLLLQQLDFLGYEALGAEDGAVALKLWRSMHFDIVITDCHMPVMTGSELTQAIRQEEKQKGVAPCMILGLTADAQPEDIDGYIALGMSDCLLKPVDLDVLEQRMLSFETRRSLKPEPGAVDPDRSSERYRVGINALTQLAGGNAAMVQSLIRELLESIRQDLQKLRLHAQLQDTSALGELAHRIRGAARVLKDEQLIVYCRELEDACSGLLPDLEGKVACVEQVMLELERVFSQPA